MVLAGFLLPCCGLPVTLEPTGVNFVGVGAVATVGVAGTVGIFVPYASIYFTYSSAVATTANVGPLPERVL